MRPEVTCKARYRISGKPLLEPGEPLPKVGLDYVYQPVVAGQITEVDVRAFANHFNELPKPVLMFCRTGNRSNNLYQLAKQMDLLDD